jgi:hypothetical protein
MFSFDLIFFPLFPKVDGNNFSLGTALDENQKQYVSIVNQLNYDDGTVELPIKAAVSGLGVIKKGKEYFSVPESLPIEVKIWLAGYDLATNAVTPSIFSTSTTDELRDLKSWLEEFQPKILETAHYNDYVSFEKVVKVEKTRHDLEVRITREKKEHEEVRQFLAKNPKILPLLDLVEQSYKNVSSSADTPEIYKVISTLRAFLEELTNGEDAMIANIFTPQEFLNSYDEERLKFQHEIKRVKEIAQKKTSSSATRLIWETVQLRLEDLLKTRLLTKGYNFLLNFIYNLKEPPYFISMTIFKNYILKGKPVPPQKQQEEEESWSNTTKRFYDKSSSILALSYDDLLQYAEELKICRESLEKRKKLVEQLKQGREFPAAASSSSLFTYAAVAASPPSSSSSSKPSSSSSPLRANLEKLLNIVFSPLPLHSPRYYDWENGVSDAGKLQKIIEPYMTKQEDDDDDDDMKNSSLSLKVIIEKALNPITAATSFWNITRQKVEKAIKYANLLDFLTRKVSVVNELTWTTTTTTTLPYTLSDSRDESSSAPSSPINSISTELELDRVLRDIETWKRDVFITPFLTVTWKENQPVVLTSPLHSSLNKFYTQYVNAVKKLVDASENQKRNIQDLETKINNAADYGKILTMMIVPGGGGGGGGTWDKLEDLRRQSGLENKTQNIIGQILDNFTRRRNVFENLTKTWEIPLNVNDSLLPGVVEQLLRAGEKVFLEKHLSAWLKHLRLNDARELCSAWNETQTGLPVVSSTLSLQNWTGLRFNELEVAKVQLGDDNILGMIALTEALNYLYTKKGRTVSNQYLHSLLTKGDTLRLEILPDDIERGKKKTWSGGGERSVTQNKKLEIISGKKLANRLFHAFMLAHENGGGFYFSRDPDPKVMHHLSNLHPWVRVYSSESNWTFLKRIIFPQTVPVCIDSSCPPPAPFSHNTLLNGENNNDGRNKADNGRNSQSFRLPLLLMLTKSWLGNTPSKPKATFNELLNFLEDNELSKGITAQLVRETNTLSFLLSFDDDVVNGGEGSVPPEYDKVYKMKDVDPTTFLHTAVVDELKKDFTKVSWFIAREKETIEEKEEEESLVKVKEEEEEEEEEEDDLDEDKDEEEKDEEDDDDDDEQSNEYDEESSDEDEESDEEDEEDDDAFEEEEEERLPAAPMVVVAATAASEAAVGAAASSGEIFLKKETKIEEKADDDDDNDDNDEQKEKMSETILEENGVAKEERKHEEKMKQDASSNVKDRQERIKNLSSRTPKSPPPSPATLSSSSNLSTERKVPERGEKKTRGENPLVKTEAEKKIKKEKETQTPIIETMGNDAVYTQPKNRCYDEYDTFDHQNTLYSTKEKEKVRRMTARRMKVQDAVLTDSSSSSSYTTTDFSSATSDEEHEIDGDKKPNTARKDIGKRVPISIRVNLPNVESLFYFKRA